MHATSLNFIQAYRNRHGSIAYPIDLLVFYTVFETKAIFAKTFSTLSI